LIKSNTKIIDVACEDNKLLEFLQKNKNIFPYSLNSGSKITEKLLDIEDKNFDYAILNNKIHSLENPKEILQEILRIANCAIISFNKNNYSIIDFENLSSSLDFVIKKKIFLSKNIILPSFLNHKRIANIFASQAFFLIKKNEFSPTLQEEFIFNKQLNLGY
jgi:ubiquinone/menaquinone biosynthesis C-methylase UbiE